MAERLARGFVVDYPDKHPPKSAKGFEWPGRAVTDEQRLAFKKNLTQYVRQSGGTHRDVARAFNGETRDDKGYVIPRNAAAILNWMNGEAWPTAEKARQLAAFLKRPMEALLVDDGKPFQPLPLIRPSRATAKRRKANGHDVSAAAHVDSPAAPASGHIDHAPLPPRPAGADPARMHVDALPDAPDYCSVAIMGVVRYDTAMALVNLIGRDQHGMGPRGK